MLTRDPAARLVTRFVGVVRFERRRWCVSNSYSTFGPRPESETTETHPTVVICRCFYRTTYLTIVMKWYRTRIRNEHRYNQIQKNMPTASTIFVNYEYYVNSTIEQLLRTICVFMRRTKHNYKCFLNIFYLSTQQALKTKQQFFHSFL